MPRLLDPGPTFIKTRISLEESEKKTLRGIQLRLGNYRGFENQYEQTQGHQSIINQSSISHQEIIKKNHQSIINPTSFNHQSIINQLSINH